MHVLKTEELFDLEHTVAKPLLEGTEYPHEVLPEIGAFIKKLSGTLDGDYGEIAEGVFAARDAKIASSAHIEAPAIIGHGAQIRHSAFIRGSVIIGDGAVVGNSTEVKNSIIFDEVQIPHYNYVGDSILGYRSHLGAGAIASNFRLDRKTVKIRENGEKLDTGLRKFGVMLGDFAEVGCNSVLCPGCIIGRRALIYPMSRVIGVVRENTVYKDGRSLPRKAVD